MTFYGQRFWLSLFLVASIPSILHTALSAQTAAPQAALTRSELANVVGALVIHEMVIT